MTIHWEYIALFFVLLAVICSHDGRLDNGGCMPTLLGCIALGCLLGKAIIWTFQNLKIV